MVLDTSAILAIFLGEHERAHFLKLLATAEVRLISAASVLETGIVLEAKRGEPAGREFDLFLNQAQVTVVAVDTDQIETARIAWRKYGKGRHSAGLSFGDCFSYALAKTTGERLLAKANDFPLTDITLCP
jgi:ribonuclease VapC